MFTDGKPWTVSEDDVHVPWGCGKDGKFFRCGFCGHRFVAGDTARWVYTNDIPEACGNPLVCAGCDAPREELVERWKAMWEETRGRMWWFSRVPYE